MTAALTSVLLAGVGGQGVLLISEILARAALAAGLDARQTEVHGVSQRGGSVYSHVRFGARVHSPLIPLGGADVVVGLELLEALRYANYARPDGVIVLNEQEVPPLSAGAAGLAGYPHDARERLVAAGLRVLPVAATALAERELGKGRAGNLVALGLVSTLLPLPGDVWPEVLRSQVPARYLELNRQAFALGVAAAEVLAPATPMARPTAPV